MLFTLILGLYYSRKITTLKEYAIGHKSFSTVILVTTLLSTTLGGGAFVNNIQQVYVRGLSWVVLTVLSCMLGLGVFSLLSIRMSAFINNLSLAETIGQIYGKLPRLVTAISSIFWAIAILAMQVNVLIQVIGRCIDDIGPTILAIIATLILIFYSTFGGIRAVTITDVLQCITFVFIIPCLAWFMFRNLNKSFIDVFTTLNTYEKFQFSHVFHWNKQSVNMLFIGLTSFVGSISPPVVQRRYMSSHVIQARNIVLLSGVFKLFIKSIILLIGVLVFVADPDLSIAAIWRL